MNKRLRGEGGGRFIERLAASKDDYDDSVRIRVTGFGFVAGFCETLLLLVAYEAGFVVR